MIWYLCVRNEGWNEQRLQFVPFESPFFELILHLPCTFQRATTNTVANTGTYYMSMEVGSTSNEMAIEVEVEVEPASKFTHTHR